MLDLPKSTEFNKRIPKQKFYEKIDVSPALKRVFVEQIKIIYWRNKLAATTLNLTPGTSVDEIEIIEIKLSSQELDSVRSQHTLLDYTQRAAKKAKPKPRRLFCCVLEESICSDDNKAQYI